MKKTAFIIPIVLIVAGIALLVISTVTNQRAAKRDQWAQAVATITKAAGPAGVVEYRYKAGGAERTGSDAGHHGTYVAGQTLIIYFNPANAAESTLELGRRPSPWIWVSGTFATLMGIVLFVFFSRPPASRRKKKRAKTVPGKVPAKKKTRPMQRLRAPQGIDRKGEE